jgi:hypothetical protein
LLGGRRAAQVSTEPLGGEKMLRLIHVTAGCFVLFAATAGVAQEAEPARVQADVKALLHALYAGDVDTVLRYTHPTIVQLQGGMQPTRGAIQQAVSKITSAGMRLESLTFPKPPEFIEAPGRRFVVVPTLSIIVANGQQVESLNFQLGVLEKDSSQWQYVEGSHINDQKVKTLFPGFPAGYTFPPFYRRQL